MSAAVASSPGYEKDQELDVAKDVAYSSAQGTSRELFGGVSIAPMYKTYLCIFGLTVMTAANSAAIQSMNVAVGFIAQSLNFEPQAIQWIVSAYTLSSGCLLLLFIPLSTQFGHREVFVFATVVYTAGAIGCSAVKSANGFIAFRVIQGIGACSGIPSGFGVLANLMPVVEGSGFRSLAIGVYAAGAPLGSAFGTLFGGLPTGLSAIQWRGIFAVLAGMGALAFVTTVWTMPPNPKQKIPGGPDWLGTAIITVGLTLVLFCLSQGPAVGWNTGYVVALLVIGCVCWPVFVFYEIWVEKRGWTPMLRMSNFKRGRFGLINFLGLWGFMSFAVWDYFAGLYYVQIHRLVPLQVMLRYLPQTIGGILAAFTANVLLRKISTQYVFLTGCACAAAGNLIFAVAKYEDNYWQGAQFLGFFLCIHGACYIYASSMLYSVNCVVPAEIPAAGGLFQVMTSIAPAFGNVIATIIQAKQLAKAPPTDLANNVKAFQLCFWTGFAFGLFALVGAIPGLWGIGIIGKSGETERVEKLVAHQHDVQEPRLDQKEDV